MSRSSSALLLRGCVVVVMLFAGASQASAATYSWLPKTGSGTWTTTSSWNLNNGTFPNAVGDVANTSGTMTGAVTITLGQAITISQLVIGDRNNTYFPTTFNAGAGGSFTFSSATGTASISMAGAVNSGSPLQNTINPPLNLDSSLNVSFTTTSGVSQIAVTGDVTTSSSGLKMIRYVPGTNATTISESALIFSGNITDGSGQIGILQNCLAPNSANSLKLTGTGNNFSGPVQILNKTLEVSPAAGANGALGTGSVQLGDVSGANNVTLNLGGSLSTVTEQNTITIPAGGSGTRTIAVTGSGNRILSGAVDQQASGLTLACPSAGNLTFSNAISGTGPITISSTGSGKVIFGGNNTNTGALTVSAGAFQLDGSLNSGSILSVAGSGFMGGSGTASGTATIGGTLNPGAASPGVLSFGSLALTATSTALVDLLAAGTRGTDYDGLTILNAGGLTYGGTMSLSFGGSALPDNTTFNVFSFTGSPSGSFGQVSSTGFYAGTWTDNFDGSYSLVSGSQAVTFTQSTGDVTVTVVPEPAAIAIAGIGVAIASAVARRRSRC